MDRSPQVGLFTHALSKAAPPQATRTMNHGLRLNTPMRESPVNAGRRPRTAVSQQSQILRWAGSCIRTHGPPTTDGRRSFGANDTSQRAPCRCTRCWNRPCSRLSTSSDAESPCGSREVYQIFGQEWRASFVKRMARRIGTRSLTALRYRYTLWMTQMIDLSRRHPSVRRMT